MIGVVIACVGVLVAAASLLLTRGLPKERPNRNWVPTAAEVVGQAAGEHPIVRFTPPGRDGTSELPCVLRQRVKDGEHLLVLLDPLNPVTPYQMAKWRLLRKISLIVVLAGLALIVAGAVTFVLMTYVFK